MSYKEWRRSWYRKDPPSPLVFWLIVAVVFAFGMLCAEIGRIYGG